MWVGMDVAVGVGVAVWVGVGVRVDVGVGVLVGAMVLVGSVVGVMMGGFAAAISWVWALEPLLPELVVLPSTFASGVGVGWEARVVGVGVLRVRRSRGMLVGVGSAIPCPEDVCELRTLVC